MELVAPFFFLIVVRFRFMLKAVLLFVSAGDVLGLTFPCAQLRQASAMNSSCFGAISPVPPFR